MADRQEMGRLPASGTGGGERSGGQSSDGGRTIALYGGSFDPPHIGHVLATAYILSTGMAGEVWWIPSYRHPFGKTLSPFPIRQRMAEAALEIFGTRQTRVLDIERELGWGGTPNYTIHTVEALVARNPGCRFRLLIGTDLLMEFHRWKEPERLLEMADLIVLGRQGYEEAFPSPEAMSSLIPHQAAAIWLPRISSSRIRDQVARGKDISTLVPHGVGQIINEERLYLDGPPHGATAERPEAGLVGEGRSSGGGVETGQRGDDSGETPDQGGGGGGTAP